MTSPTGSRLLAVLIGVALVTSACGGATKHTRPPAGAKRSVAGAIEQRLRKSGYSINTEAGATVPLLAGPARARPVGELANFSIKADFTSPNSFTVDITVFASHQDLLRTAQREAVARRRAIKLCAQIPQCRAFRRSKTSVPSPTLIQQTATKIVGGVLYTAVEDSPSGKLPRPAFEGIVALASGHADH